MNVFSHTIEIDREKQREGAEGIEELEAESDELCLNYLVHTSTSRQIKPRAESVNSLKQERSGLEEELERLPETPRDDQQHLETEI